MRTQRPVHFLLAALGVVLWFIIVLQIILLIWLARLGAWVWPDADMGNCYTFALASFRYRNGDCLTIHRRSARTPIPHIVLTHGPMGGPTEQTEPVTRHKGWRAFLHSLYFRYRVTRTER